MLTLDIQASVFKFLNELQAKQYKQIAHKMFSLMKDARPHDSLEIGESAYRTDIGEYRIIYEFDEQTIRALAIGKRRFTNSSSGCSKLRPYNQRSSC